MAKISKNIYNIARKFAIFFINTYTRLEYKK